MKSWLVKLNNGVGNKRKWSMKLSISQGVQSSYIMINITDMATEYNWLIHGSCIAFTRYYSGFWKYMDNKTISQGSRCQCFKCCWKSQDHPHDKIAKVLSVNEVPVPGRPFLNYVHGIQRMPWPLFHLALHCRDTCKNKVPIECGTIGTMYNIVIWLAYCLNIQHERQSSNPMSASITQWGLQMFLTHLIHLWCPS